ncbi:MAG: replication initiator protein A [Vicinamibacteraceae bacterium]
MLSHTDAGASRKELASCEHRQARRILVEKNLATLGFFTPSSSRIKQSKAKTVRFSKVIDGQRIETSATIVPSALHGLPITADQDKYLALQELLRAERCASGRITNPLTFSTGALLRALHICSNSGKNYADVAEWLDLIASTTIISEGAVFLAGARRWTRDRFRVFDRAISCGRQLDDGSIAERNYVWLSAWQLQNVNNNHVLPIDLDLYQRLNTHIARALIPLLQVWLYASQRSQVFEKRYDDLCQLLGLRPYPHRSKIVEKLGPALDELTWHGYLAAWRVDRTADGTGFKIVLQHGPAFTAKDHSPTVQVSAPHAAGHRLTTEDSALQVNATSPSLDRGLLHELTRRGISERQARKVLTTLPTSRDVIRQLEWGDFVIARSGHTRIWNPAGFYLTLLRDHVEPPAHFRSSRERLEREQGREALAAAHAHDADLRQKYESYRDQQAAAYLEAMDPDERERLLAAKAADLKAQHRGATLWPEQTLRSLASVSARQTIARSLPLMDFQRFIESQNQSTSEHSLATGGANDPMHATQP